MTATGLKLECKRPTLFTTGAILTGSLYGLILVIPLIASMMAMTVVQFGVLTFLIPLAAIALATFFLPIGFGNPYIVRLVEALRPAVSSNEDLYVVQLTRDPRIRSGLLALLEDADDIGFLSYTDSGLEFTGDSVRFSVPYNGIRDLRQQNAGSRALFAYGPQTTFSVPGLPEAGRLKFAERSSWFLPTSRKNARRMYRRLRARIDGTAADVAADRK